MRLKIYFILLSLTILAFPSFGFAAGESILSSPSRLQEAIKLQKLGKYLEARSIYDEILKEPGISKKENHRIRRQYENLNMKLLFSNYETPESQTHLVKPGDTLLKISKKYNTTIELIKKTNALTRDTIYPDRKLKILRGSFSILVDKSSNSLILLLDDKVFKRYQVATGANNGTPVGQFKIINKLENPTWYKAGAVVPPGSPENSLGTRWLGFDQPSYGIHGTTEPESIGHHVTSGCVRMLNKHVEELYLLIPLGTIVRIKD